MKITDKNECKERPVDLVETFNYLIGLTVTRQSAISYWLSKPAEYPPMRRWMRISPPTAITPKLASMM